MENNLPIPHLKQTLKRIDKEWEHEQSRLVKVKIDLQNRLATLKREMASQLDRDPALAALVAGCEIQRSVRTSESGADEASSMGELMISVGLLVKWSNSTYCGSLRLSLHHDYSFASWMDFDSTRLLFMA